MNINLSNYEKSVLWLRSQPEYSELVKLCYLDEDNFTAAKRFASSAEFSEIIKLVKLKKSNRKLEVLDLGCGNGIASYAFASLGHNVFSVDPDPSKDVGIGATEKLVSKVAIGSISVFQGFAESLPFANSTFDVVYARQALHHFNDLSKGLSECSRVLKSRGLLLATREHVVSDDKQLKEFLENHILHRVHGGENAYSLDNYTAAIQKTNLKILRCIAPFDNVINHFPTSDLEIKSWLLNSIQKKFGETAASILVHFPVFELLYRNRLSSSCNFPGRLYSFLCIKK